MTAPPSDAGPSAALGGGEQFGKYRVEATLGSGGMGVVHLATDLSLGRRVALKLLGTDLGHSEEFRRRFDREINLLARLDSPHVIAVYDHGVERGRPYFVTQFVAGGDLGALVRARGRMPRRLALSVCAQVAEALDDAHRAGIIHRDVKPANVLLRDPDAEDLHAYLCDFGIARTATDALTSPGAVAGTWAYLAPECGLGTPASPASDIYALGCLLWVCLTGSPPYGGSDVAVALAHQQAPLPQLPGDDADTRALNEVLRKALAKDPRDRYADADRLRRALLAVPSWGDAPGASPRVEPRLLTGRRRPLRRLLAAALTLVVVAGAGVLVVELLGRPSSVSTGAPTSAPLDAAGPSTSPVTGDLNGDGLGDATFRIDHDLNGSLQSGSVTERPLWHSTGGALRLADNRPLGDHEEHKSYLEDLRGDFDGDGSLDHLRVSGAVGLNTPALLRLDGTLSGGRSVTARLDLPTNTLPDVAAGDLDGDGDEDLLISADYDSGATSLLESFSEGGRFSSPRTVEHHPAPSNGIVEYVPGDFDGDGRLDVMRIDGASAEASFKARLLLGTGSATEDEGPAFRSATGRDYSTTCCDTVFAAADLSGTGHDDLIVVSPAGRSISTIDYSGDALTDAHTAAAATAVPAAATHEGTDAEVSDVNGDGRDDLVLASPDGHDRVALSVALSSGTVLTVSIWTTWQHDLGPISTLFIENQDDPLF